MKLVLSILILVFPITTVFGQDRIPEKLKIFLDCNNTSCDDNYLRTEIGLVDFVLDRLAAEVHILITSQPNGSGGERLQFIFFGQNKFQNTQDTLLSNLDPNATAVERRTEIVKKVKLGLIPFISDSPYARFIDINLKTPKVADEHIKAAGTKDKWNYWVYRIDGDGTFNTDQVYKSTQLSGTLSAHRTTDKLKVNFALYASFNSSSYEYQNNGSSSLYKVSNNDYLLSHYLVKSIGQRWGLGYEAHYSNNTFSNNKRRKYLRGAIEYAVFPYSKVNNKFFTINYGLDVRDNAYYETTIYNKKAEVLWGHKAQANLSVKQKWGSVNSSISYRSYFKDWDLNNFSSSVNVSVRITGGLSFYIFSYGGLIHDQVYLVKGDATEQEILTRRRQLASSFNFYSGAGLNFRFGSILNNFVNPRFDNL